MRRTYIMLVLHRDSDVQRDVFQKANYCVPKNIVPDINIPFNLGMCDEIFSRACKNSMTCIRIYRQGTLERLDKNNFNAFGSSTEVNATINSFSSNEKKITAISQVKIHRKWFFSVIIKDHSRYVKWNMKYIMKSEWFAYSYSMICSRLCEGN